MYVCMDVWMHACKHAVECSAMRCDGMHGWVYVWTHGCVGAWTHVCMCACMRAVCMNACTFACMHVCVFACLYDCIFACLQACKHVPWIDGWMDEWTDDGLMLGKVYDLWMYQEDWMFGGLRACMHAPTLSFCGTKLLWGNIAHCGKHGDPSVLKFGLTTSLEVLNAAISGKACGIPEPGWRLHTQLVLERSQRRGSVVGPVSPCASSQAILHGIVWFDQLLSKTKHQKSQQNNPGL